MAIPYALVSQAIGLSSASGTRAGVSLLALSVAALAGLVELPPELLWMTQPGALAGFAAVLAFEMFTQHDSRLVAEQRGMTVREFVTDRAEYRNKLLYADDAGFVPMGEDLETLLRNVFTKTLRDLLWCLAVLLGNSPVARNWGIVSQFISLYRRVLAEARV